MYSRPLSLSRRLATPAKKRADVAAGTETDGFLGLRGATSKRFP